MSDNPYLDALQTPDPATSLPDAAPKKNPYLQALDDAEGAKRTQLQASLRTSVPVNPDEAAKARKLSASTGIPQDVVTRNLPDVQQQESIREADNLLARYPYTADRMRNPGFAQVAHDDVQNMGLIEDTVKAITATGRYLFSADDKTGLGNDVRAGYHGASSGAAGVFRAAFEFAASGAEGLIPGLKFNEQNGVAGGNPLRRMADAFGDISSQEAKGSQAAGSQFDSILGKGVSSGFQSLTQNAITAPLLFLPGGQGAALAAMSGQQGGTSYNKAREKGVDQNTALAYGASDAAIEFATEKMPLTKLLGDLKAGTGLLKTVMGQAVREIPGEQLATVLQDMNEWVILNPEKTFKDYLAERPGAAAQTLIATLIGVGGHTTAVHAIDKTINGAEHEAKKAQAATVAAQHIESLVKLAEASKLRERDPASFRDFVDQLAAEGDTPGDVYISAETLVNSLNQSGMSMPELQALAPVTASQLQAAASTGADVRVPVGEMMSASVEFTAPLIDHIRITPDAMTRAEAGEFIKTYGDKLREDVNAGLSRRDNSDEFRQQIEGVRTHFETELNNAKRFTPAVNKAYSELLANFYGATASRLGMTPEALLDRYKLRVQAQGVAGERTLNQGSLETVREAWSAKGIKHAISEQDGTIEVGQIVVPEGRREQGAGTAAMQQLLGYADATGQRVVLTPSSDFGGTKSRLEKFYKGLGFKANKGKSKDFTTRATMIREPKQGAAQTKAGDQTQTPEFKAWFGDSKVVDAEGKPQVVYHGTNDSFTKVNFKKGAQGLFWFTSDRASIESGDAGAQGSKNIMELFAKIENPAGWKEYDKYGVDELQRMGYDGVILPESNGSFTGFIFKDAAQVKSATKNRGTFNPNDANILNQSAIPSAEQTTDENGNPEINSQSVRLMFAQPTERFEFIPEAGQQMYNMAIIEPGNWEPVGYVEVVYENGKLTGLYDIEVSESTRSRGIGAKAIEAILAANPDQSILISNVVPAARGFWEKVGVPQQNVGEGDAYDGTLDWNTYAASEAGRKSLQAGGNTGTGGSNTQGAEGGGTGPVSGVLEQGALDRATLYQAAAEYQGAHKPPGPDSASLHDLTANGTYPDDVYGPNGQRWYGDGSRRDSEAFSIAQRLKGRPNASVTIYRAVPHEKTTAELLTQIENQIAKYMARRLLPSGVTDEVKWFEEATAERDRLRAAPAEAKKDAIKINPGDWVTLTRDYAREHGQGALGGNYKIISKTVTAKELFTNGDSIQEWGYWPANTYNQDERPAAVKGEMPRAQISFGPDITATPSVISLLAGADLSSFLHESGHFFLEVQSDLATRIQQQIDSGASVSPQERGIVDDMNRLLEWFGVKGSENQAPLAEWASMTLDEKREHHEKFARGFERYTMEGNAPSIALQEVFSRFRSWLVQVYKTLKGLNVELNDDVRAVMGRMLATDMAIEEAEAARNMGPLFKDANIAGMTLEEFQDYQATAQGATDKAAAELQTRSMKDMKWLSRAKDKALKARQEEVDSLRREIKNEVRSEVMAEPVYQAWQFLTMRGAAESDTAVGKKESRTSGLDLTRDNLFRAIAMYGGLSRTEVSKAWGIDPKDKLESGVFGKPVVRKEGGKSLDSILEALVEDGYILPDEHGKGDPAKLEEAFDAQRQGVDQFSTWHDYAGEQPVIPLGADKIAGKLNTDMLRDQYGAGENALWRKLSARRMTSDKGISPEIAADTFGFDSGDHLVNALAEATPPQEVIDARTDQRMLEMFGDISSPEALQQAADAAVHNEMRAKAVASELRALQDANTVREKRGKNSVDVLAKAAREYAAGIISRMKVRDLRPGQYTAAAARNGKMAEAALKKGDLEGAALHKRNQLINVQAAIAANQATDDVKSALAMFKRVEKPGRIPASHYEQIVQLLERFDLRKATTNAEIDNRASFLTWAKRQLDNGEIPPNVEALLSKAGRAKYETQLQQRNDDGELIYADAEKQIDMLAGLLDAEPARSYKEMTVEEFRGLRDTIEQIDHVGRRIDSVLTAKDKRLFKDEKERLEAHIVSVAEKRGRYAKDNSSPNTIKGERRLGVLGFFFSHVKASNLVNIMDGGAGGLLGERLVETAAEASNNEQIQIGEYHKKVQALLDQLPDKGRFKDKPMLFKSIGESLNRNAVLSMAMEMGNASNKQRLLGGKGWTEAQVKSVLDTLSAADWHFVQGMWNLYEEMRPAVGALERKIRGVEPEWVQAEGFTVQTSDGQTINLRGGYSPVVYDPRANGKAMGFADEKQAKDMMQVARMAANVNRSFTKPRVEEVNGRPLLMSLDAKFNAIQDTIHYLNWQEWTIDSNRMVKALDPVIREHYGHESIKLLRDWVGDLAAGVAGPRNAGERWMAGLARNVSFAGLAFNLVSAAGQVAGYTQSMVVLGEGEGAAAGSIWMMKGVAKSMASPRAAYLEAIEKSDFLLKRSTTRIQAIAELSNQVKGQSKLRQKFDQLGYAPMMAMQTAVDIPTWWAGYDKAISQGHSEERAVALADQVVKDAQGSGLQTDLSSVERATGAMRLFTGFMSFMNTTMNLNYRVLKSDTNAGRKALDLALVNVIPVMIAMSIKALLTPGDADKDKESMLKRYAREQFSYIFGQMLVARELSQIWGAFQGQPNSDYGGSVGMRGIGDLYKLAKQIGQGDADEAALKAAVSVAGDILRLPTAAINRAITGVSALNKGKTENPTAVVMGYQKPH